MKASYVGILTEGATSRMRAEVLKALTPDWDWTWVDTHPPYQQAPRWAKTLSFRLKAGPVISQTNSLVRRELASSCDLVWVDKAANLSVATTQHLRRYAGKLIHFTPDTAFHTNRSRSFNRSLEYYDWAITTKSFEATEYYRWLPAEKLIQTTQGYNAELHLPRHQPSEKQAEAVFIGLCEPDRERCLDALLNADIPIRLAGVGWERFVQKHASNSNLRYEGRSVFGEDYANMLSGAWVGLGLLSKVFPELHTTRTFEIPACGSVLATEINNETSSYFAQNEALFFTDYNELADQLTELLSQSDRLAKIAAAGLKRVKTDRRDYRSILEDLLTKTGFSPPERS